MIRQCIFDKYTGHGATVVKSSVGASLPANSDDLSRTVLAGQSVNINDDELSIPADANHAEIQVWDADGIAWRVDGGEPGQGQGYLTSFGGYIELESRQEILNFKVISLGDGGSIFVTYFKLNQHIE